MDMSGFIAAVLDDGERRPGLMPKDLVSPVGPQKAHALVRPPLRLPEEEEYFLSEIM
jgi:hypothetical protein